MDVRRAIRDLINASPAYPLVQGQLERLRERQALRAWADDGGRGATPHLVKQGILREYAQRYGLRTLVESGTYLGSMVHAMRDCFDRIITVEVEPNLAARARRRFARAPHVTVLEGDSGGLMADVVGGLRGPALFWLDGHYSGGITGSGESHCPVMKELPPILGDTRFEHVILIDDARLFGVDPAYPTTDEVRATVLAARPNYTARLDLDVLRYAPA